METNLAYREEPRWELIGGKVVMMSSPVLNHIFIAGNIYAVFSSYLRGKPCTPLGDGASLYLEAGEEYRPDMMVVCDPEKLRRKGVYGAPDLVVEVLSPSTGKHDKGHKKEVYERHGVREYWIVSPGDRSVEQYVLEDGRFVLREVYTHYTREMTADMTEAELADMVTDFRCSLFDDLTIRLEDIFYRVRPDF